MNELDAQLERVAANRGQLPEPTLPEVPVIGRSNVGKSSFINTLTGRKGFMRVSNSPGRTGAVFFVNVGGRGYVVDLPGYGFAKVPLPVKRAWADLVEAYLARAAKGGGILLVDARREPNEGDRQMVSYFRHYGRPFSVVMTKVDKISRGRWKGRATAIADALGLGADQEPIPFSAVTNEGAKRVLRLIEEYMEQTA